MPESNKPECLTPPGDIKIVIVGEIISESWARSNRYTRARSSESAIMLSGKLFSDVGLLRHAKSSNNSLKSKKADKADASGGNKGEAEIKIFHTVLQTPSSRVPMLAGVRRGQPGSNHHINAPVPRARFLSCSFVVTRLKR